MAKLGKNTRLGSGDTPASPLQSSISDDWYVIKKYRSDDEYEMECEERDLHRQPVDLPADSDYA
jgi:hypothetical protein